MTPLQRTPEVPNESGAFNAFKLHGCKPLGQILDEQRTKSRRGISSIYRQNDKTSGKVDQILS